MLFVGNDQSSPEIAANLLRRLVGDDIEVVTAGAQPAAPGGRADDILVQMGLNPASEERLSVRDLRTADRVVVLGAGLDVARVPGQRYEEWDVEHDDLEERVRVLGLELRAGPAPAPPTSLRDRALRRLLAVAGRTVRAVRGLARRVGRRQ